jgi:hypothetical protein
LRKKATSCRFNVVSRSSDGSISISNGHRSSQNASSNAKVAIKIKKRATALISMKSEVCEGKVVLDLPLQTVSEANCFEHWTAKNARHKHQRRVVALALKPLCDKIKLPCKIHLTRVAPNELDAFENLPMSFKYIVDAVCAIITGDYRPGRADSDKRITLSCDQIKSAEYGVRISFTF